MIEMVPVVPAVRRGAVSVVVEGWGSRLLLAGGDFVVWVVYSGIVSIPFVLAGADGVASLVIALLLGAVVAFVRCSPGRSEASRPIGVSHSAGAGSDACQWQVRIAGIVHAVPVDGLEDMGPAYVIETSDGECVFVAGAFLEAVVNDDGEVHTTIELEVDQASRVIERATGYGPVINESVTEIRNIQDLGVPIGVEFAILRPSHIAGE